ncbi:hypothetical protein AGMMS50289_15990 [Betaproteobacteria bacterium]|nr:hypothetical protein AGMMS50289_15990 [Betaproteobacteria bacterium]
MNHGRNGKRSADIQMTDNAALTPLKMSALLAFLLLFPDLSKSDAPMPLPADKVFCSLSGRYCLKTDIGQKSLIMMDNAPASSSTEIRTAKLAFGSHRFSVAASDVKFPSTSKELWRIGMQKTPGFYRVADDGVHYVEYDHGNMLESNDPQQIVYQFYAKDIKLKALKLNMLLHDLSSLIPTTSHFNWARDDVMSDFFDTNDYFVIRTLENRELWFDTTGTLLRSHPILPPRR